MHTWYCNISGRKLLLLLVLPGALAVNVVNPNNKYTRASWGYTEFNGPATWPGSYATCAGNSQSPINIVTTNVVAADPGSLGLGAYDSPMTGEITNNEHTITFTYTDGIQPYVTDGRLPAGDTFQFLQLHWHWGSASNQGSEHTVDGKEYPAEVHLVHWNTKYADVTEAVSKDDGLAVLCFFYEVSSADNGNLDAMLSVVNQVKNRQLQINAQNRMKNKGERNNLNRAEINSATVPGTIRLDQLLPINGLPDDYYYYKGSLTTPTCDEVVLWTVFPTTVPISEAQLNIFRTLKDSNSVTLNDNYRPPQALNGRTVYKRVTEFSDNGGEPAAAQEAPVAIVVTVTALTLYLAPEVAPGSLEDAGYLIMEFVAMYIAASTLYNNAYSVIGCSEISQKAYRDSALEALLSKTGLFEERVVCPINVPGINLVPEGLIGELPAETRLWGGLPVLFTTAVSASITGPPVGATGLVRMMGRMGRSLQSIAGCSPGQCMRRNRCCDLVMRRGRPSCPRTCAITTTTTTTTSTTSLAIMPTT